MAQQQAVARNKPQSNKAKIKSQAAALTRRDLRIACFANRAMCRLQLEKQEEGVIADCSIALALLKQQASGAGGGCSPAEAAAAEKLQGKVLYRLRSSHPQTVFLSQLELTAIYHIR